MGVLLRRISGVLLLGLFLSVAWLHCSSWINFVTADLGRHIKNGELAWIGREIISTNHYSYTYPELPTICHHWGAGIIFFLVWKCAGFLGLSMFYTALLVLTLGIFIGIAARLSSLRSALLVAALVLPLIAYRTEIRPEGFTSLFLGIGLLVLSAYRQGKIPGRWLWALPLVQVLWVNTHIVFTAGLFLIAFFIIDAAVIYGRGERLRHLARVGLGCVAASLLNPAGIAGFLEPFNIMRDFGYKLAENQSVLFMINRFPGTPVYTYSLAILVLALAVLILRFSLERKWRLIVLPALLFVFFGGAAFFMVRQMAVLGLVLIPVLAESWEKIMILSPAILRNILVRLTAVAAVMMIGLAAVVPYFYLSPLKEFAPRVAAPYRNSFFSILVEPQVWGGLVPGINASAEFFRDQGMKGPIFNNYDIGGYLIYHLFPSEKAFVDNRPEAYPGTFFREIYAPMQEDEKVWKDALKRYGFQVIYFYRHDMTTWAQPFLIRRIQDPEWAPVFVDAWTIILARRNGVNQSVIRRNELPQSMFKVQTP